MTQEEFKELEKLVDNGTIFVSVATPEGWKCPKKGCMTDFKHTHSTYDSLFKTSSVGPSCFID